MATQLKILQGETSPQPEENSKDVEILLAGFLRALLDEQKVEERSTGEEK